MIARWRELNVSGDNRPLAVVRETFASISVDDATTPSLRLFAFLLVDPDRQGW
ncbi:hypothetical protein MNBD_ACTINO02-540 [hydrothermal vent metagenome]|uniref:Uncharacterized protein n=1 Tax=hydrothermal vent metagenome TaxID=652676 RepID=A0A3B0SX29_9ZZZZ